jgi:prepilin-type N-terminal cleavage/methylation domain-containing protein/prepilin-type processing-associated H-X9-DG protein
MNRHKGFTLIELLVVIAIIAILAAILFPVFTSAKDSAKNSGCCSNLSQIGKAFSMYLDDNNGWYPAPVRQISTAAQRLHPKQDRACVTWDVAIYKYIKNTAVFCCPSDRYTRVDNTGRLTGGTPILPRSYSINPTGDGQADQYIAWTLGQMKPQTSKYILLSEWLKNSNYYGTGKHAWNNFGGWDCVVAKNRLKTGLHLNGKVANYLFFDGHVKSVDPHFMKNESWYYMAK